MGNKSSSNKLPPQAKPAGNPGTYVDMTPTYSDTYKDAVQGDYERAGLQEIWNQSGAEQNRPQQYTNGARWDTNEPQPNGQQAANLAVDQAFFGGGRLFSKNDPVFKPATPEQLDLPGVSSQAYKDILANDQAIAGYNERANPANHDPNVNILGDEYDKAGLAYILRGGR
jgi:hypothetical protein